MFQHCCFVISKSDWGYRVGVFVFSLSPFVCRHPKKVPLNADYPSAAMPNQLI